MPDARGVPAGSLATRFRVPTLLSNRDAAEDLLDWYTDHWDEYGGSTTVELVDGFWRAYLGAGMRHNPQSSYCTRRGCGHRASFHRGACLIEHCECDELREG